MTTRTRSTLLLTATTALTKDIALDPDVQQYEMYAMGWDRCSSSGSPAQRSTRTILAAAVVVLVLVVAGGATAALAGGADDQDTPMTRDDGTEVDVQLDEDFRVVGDDRRGRRAGLMGR